MDATLGVWCARVSPGKLLPLQPERDLKISNLSLGTDVQNGRTTVQLHFKPLKWDEKGIINEPTPRTISSTIICVLAPGMLEHATPCIALRRGEYYVFEVSGTNEVHLTGNYIEAQLWPVPAEPLNAAARKPVLVSSSTDVQNFLYPNPAAQVHEAAPPSSTATIQNFLFPKPPTNQGAAPTFKFDSESFHGFHAPKFTPIPEKKPMVARKDNKEGVTRKRKQGDQPQAPVNDIKADTNANPFLKQNTISPQVNPAVKKVKRTLPPPGFVEETQAVNVKSTPILQAPMEPGPTPQTSSKSSGKPSVRALEEKRTRAPDTKPTKVRQSLKPHVAPVGDPQPPKALTPTEAPRVLPAADPPKASANPNTGPTVTARTPQTPTEAPHVPPKPPRTIPREKAPTEPHNKTQSGPSKSSLLQTSTKERPPTAPTAKPREGHQIVPIFAEDHLWKVAFKDDVIGDGPVAQEGYKILLWYFCRIKETSFVYQQSTATDGPPVKPSAALVLGSGTFPRVVEQTIVGMKVGGTRVIQVPPALASIDMNWREYTSTMKIPENSTVEFYCKLFGSEYPHDPSVI